MNEIQLIRFFKKWCLGVGVFAMVSSFFFSLPDVLSGGGDSLFYIFCVIPVAMFLGYGLGRVLIFLSRGFLFKHTFGGAQENPASNVERKTTRSKGPNLSEGM